MSNEHDRPNGAVDQEAFEQVIRDNLSPAGVAAIIAFLQPATANHPSTDEQPCSRSNGSLTR